MADMLRFLKGTQEGLDTLISGSKIQTGAFYLTNDTNRLYIGKSSDNAELLNNGVQVVANVASLPSAPPAIDGDFYYCKAENVFAVYNKEAKEWVQINVDSYVSEVTNTVSLSGDTATINTKVGDSNNHSQADAFKITAGDDVNIAVSGKEITISAVDEKTTETGHYAPTTEAGTYSVNSGSYVTGVKYDSKGHIIGVTSGTPAERTHSITVTETEGVATVSSVVDGKAASFKVTGAGATTVKESSDNVITITSIDEHTTKAGHYDPTADDSAELSLSNKILTTVSRDDNGHVTAIDGVASKESLSSTVANGTNEATFTYTAKNIFGVEAADNVKVKGAGATTVSGDATNKTITVTSTDRSVTESQYHYAPTAVDGSKLSLTNKILTEVSRDDKGHVTAIDGVDTQESIAHSVVATTNGASVSTTTKTIFGVDKADNFTITGSGATSVTGSGKTVTISSTDEKVTAVGNHYTPSKSTQKDASDSATATAAKAQTPVITGIEMDAAGHVTGVISKKISDTHNTIKSAELGITNGKLTLAVANNDGDSAADAQELKIVYGENDSATAALADDGSWNLDVYTTSETNAKIAAAVGANGAVQVVGTIATQADLTGKTGIKTGDTYIVTSTDHAIIFDNTTSSGDMFIAKADKASGSTADDWYYVPAGNDVVKTGGITDGFQLQEGVTDTILGEVKFVNSTSNEKDFQVAPTVLNAAGVYNTTTVSYNLYWGEF